MRRLVHEDTATALGYGIFKDIQKNFQRMQDAGLSARAAQHD